MFDKIKKKFYVKRITIVKDKTYLTSIKCFIKRGREKKKKNCKTKNYSNTQHRLDSYFRDKFSIQNIHTTRDNSTQRSYKQKAWATLSMTSA